MPRPRHGRLGARAVQREVGVPKNAFALPGNCVIHFVFGSNVFWQQNIAFTATMSFLAATMMAVLDCLPFTLTGNGML
jgi:hypothetical protein